MSNYGPISKIFSYVKLEGHSIERIQLNTDIILCACDDTRPDVWTLMYLVCHAANRPIALKVFKYCFNTERVKVFKYKY